MITERPILFSAPMVLALLAGTKTQTRRLVKPQPFWQNLGDGQPNPMPTHRYGTPGDRLWVKETWRPIDHETRKQNHYGLRRELIRYNSDGLREWRQVARGWRRPKAARSGNVSPLFMPKWASRITLEITSVRIERLQDISESDARAEGIVRLHPAPARELYDMPGERGIRHFATATHAYRALWESINGFGSWDVNHWVWAIAFKLVPR